MTAYIKSDITSMMIRRDDRTLALNSEDTDSDAYQIEFSLKHLPEFLQPILTSDPDKLPDFLSTFFEKAQHPQGFDFCYAYKIHHADRSIDVITILTPERPASADDFFDLAVAINNHTYYHGVPVVVCDEQGTPVTEQKRKIFIFSLLQDAALSGHLRAANALSNLKQDAKKENYHCLSQFNFLFNYKHTYNFIALPYALTMPEEFFDLANNPALANRLFVFVNQQVSPSDNQNLNECIYSLLSDAAKAGHVQAKDQLINATIDGNAHARKFVIFKEYNPELPIKLPRKMVTAADFRKLAISLITHGKFITANMCALHGPFYIVENGKMAEKYGYALLKRANQLQMDEDEQRKQQVETFYYDTTMKKPTVMKVEEARQDSSQWTSLYHTFFHNSEETQTPRKLLDIEEQTAPTLKCF